MNNKIIINIKKQDEYYTPKCMVEMILPYIPKNKIIWCPFDTEKSEFVINIKKNGNKVIYSHICYNQDFLYYTPKEKFDIIISNPPFSIKNKVFKKVQSFNKKKYIYKRIIITKSTKQKRKNKLKKIILILLICNIIFAKDLKIILNSAIEYINNDEYELARKDLLYLIEQKYNNPYVYFALGRVYRELEEPEKAIQYFKNYLNETKSKKNIFAVKINIAYSLLEKNTFSAMTNAKEIVDKINTSEYSNSLDFSYCYASVYNTIGYYLLSDDTGKSGDEEYYNKIIIYFKKALNKRKELVGVANNLAIAYIRVIEILNKSNPLKAKKYAHKVDKLLNDDFYNKFQRGKIQDTREYFNKYYKKILK
jgi:hypothetical protein